MGTQLILYPHLKTLYISLEITLKNKLSGYCAKGYIYILTLQTEEDEVVKNKEKIIDNFAKAEESSKELFNLLDKTIEDLENIIHI